MMRVAIACVLAAVFLTACEKDAVVALREETKACGPYNGRGGASGNLPVNIETKTLDDGRVQCIITTVHPMVKKP